MRSHRCLFVPSHILLKVEGGDRVPSPGAKRTLRPPSLIRGRVQKAIDFRSRTSYVASFASNSAYNRLVHLLTITLDYEDARYQPPLQTRAARSRLKFNVHSLCATRFRGGAENDRTCRVSTSPVAICFTRRGAREQTILQSNASRLSSSTRYYFKDLH